MPEQLWQRPAFRWLVIMALLLFALATPLFAASFGAAQIDAADVWHALCHHLGGSCDVSAIKQRIVIDIRLPRVILAFVAGAGLALSGAVLQTVTRNPLADPYLFGISSGASLGAVIVIAVLGIGHGIGLPLGAFCGSALAVILVMAMSSRSGPGQVERMLLAGVATSFMLSAMTSLALYTSDPQATASVLFWTLGSFTRASWDNIWLPVVVTSSCLLLFIGFSRQLNAILAGEESARTLGVNVARLRVVMLLLSSLITATLVAYCGGIAFVGLMIPHLVRMLLGVNVLRSLLATCLAGGLFMVWIDVLARKLLPGQELPVGVITSALGSLFFLIILRRRSAGMGS
ncbi:MULTISPECIES: FecCD family ABC transporter permease [Corallincola]|uniref:Iron ABC transporter permease n=3 Tax=Corallincola TaxID=1775176 RepID=A0A368NNV7_9GAMM|nr:MULTISPECIES: iron ABC transporter permease [Corallincola]RCU51790.1 iron ABC transporter permease [Corallincola holothuriorum]TAA47282.1 iron ABC transporter permease [Corallincola spongiicola]TCI04942.1 iron ABC transporter permease [Corallincola luteus]